MKIRFPRYSLLLAGALGMALAATPLWAQPGNGQGKGQGAAAWKEEDAQRDPTEFERLCTVYLDDEVVRCLNVRRGVSDRRRWDQPVAPDRHGLNDSNGRSVDAGAKTAESNLIGEP